MNIKLSVAALIVAASSTYAMAQATGTENNATSGSAPSSSEQQGKIGSDNNSGMSTGTPMPATKPDTPTAGGTSNDKVKNLPGHSETPTTGKSQ